MASAREIEKALFDAARSLSEPAAVRAFLDQACQGNAGLRSRLERLLAVQGPAEKFFASPVEVKLAEVAQNVAASLGEAAAQPVTPASAKGTEALDMRIGPYKLLQRLGEGGCGVVYMAEQETPVRRRVALKIIRLGMDTENVVARFEAERQALAMMDHPNIARVLDAGATETGRPYFVMELVRGVKITEYCNVHQLDTRERLELFIQVCHAIQHAHQKGVIHRDIKPSNILITLHDGVPVPKVIDFGIAKAIEGKLTDNTLFTAYEQFIGTPAYMSPEQAEMSGLDVDTRSDLYSLGVLLYELLTGRTPFDTKKLIESGVEEIRRTLREHEPRPPSTILTTLENAELKSIATQRHAEPVKLISALRGDLDWIVMKALEKDRRRRYETANGLAMDVRRYLNNEPVIARPPSQLYRLQKLVRRNRVTFTAIAAVLLALLTGTVVSTWLFWREREMRRRAVAAEQQQSRLRQEADRLRQVAENRQKLTEATVLVSRNEMADADALIDSIPAPTPSLEYASLFRSLGEWHVTNARWRKAAARFAILVQINQPSDWDSATLDYLRYAPLLLELGETERYKELRRAGLKRFARSDNPLVAERVIDCCLLLPPDPDMLAALEPMAESAAKSLETSSVRFEGDMAAWRSLTLALFEYRSGNPRLAVDWCDRSLDYESVVGARVASVRLLRAMGRHRLGLMEGVANDYWTARTAVEEAFKQDLKRSGTWSGYWFDWMVARIFLNEATELMAVTGRVVPKP
jgi:serine/threonine protein kinase